MNPVTNYFVPMVYATKGVVCEEGSEAYVQIASRDFKLCINTCHVLVVRSILILLYMTLRFALQSFIIRIIHNYKLIYVYPRK